MLKKIVYTLSKMEVYKRFLISYLLILIIPIFFSVVVYNQALKTIEQDAIDTRLFMIEHTRDSLDGYLMNLDNYTNNMMINSKVNRLLSYKQPQEGDSDMYWFYEFFNEFKYNAIKSNDFDGFFYMFFNESESIYSNNSMSFGFEQYYKETLNFEGMDYNQWYGKFMETRYFKDILPEAKVNIDGVAHSVIPYLTSVPLGEKANINGLMLYLIDEDKVIELLEGVNTGNMGWTYILDGEGAVISSTNSEGAVVDYDTESNTEGYYLKDINGEKMLCIYAKSNFNDWIYTNILPISEVMKKAENIKQIAGIMVVFAFIIGFLASLILTYWNTKQFKTLVRTLKDFLKQDVKANKEENDYEFLQGSIHKLIKNDSVMRSSIEHQEVVLKTVFWDKVFNGQFHNKDDMEALMKHVGLYYSNQKFIVAVVKLNRQDIIMSAKVLTELDILRASIESLIVKFLGDHCYIHMLNENEIAIMMNFGIDSDIILKTLVSDTLNKVSNEVSSQFSIKPIFGVGNECISLMDVQSSLNEAQQALNISVTQVLEDKTVFWYNDIKTERVIYFYPNNIEQKLINCVKSGNQSDVNPIIDHVYKENYSERVLSTTMEKMLFSDMQATIIKLLEEIRMDVDFYDYNLLEKQRPDEFFEEIKRVYENLCDFIVRSNKNHNTKLKDDILEFVNLNYTDSNMCVYMVASRFKLSESYFSQFFKESSGVNFSIYVENARIQKACELVTGSNISLDEVAKQIGYNNTHTFRRAFKKVMGVVPSSYKK